MEQHARDSAIERLNWFVGEWRMDASLPDAPVGGAVFEWLAGEQFLVQRWGFPHPAALDGIDGVDFGGISLIGLDRGGQAFVQHYFDSRGVARVYRMSFTDGVWKLWRDSADFSPLEFWQSFTGTFSKDGKSIQGRWEISYDGSSWERDFDLTYTKVT
jgi:hypothetical protein